MFEVEKMKLIYRILCVDDKIGTLDETKTYLSSFNERVGIETIYTDIEVKPGAREEPDDFWTRIVTEIESAFAENTYDLILVDLHMPLNVSGVDVIESIRTSHSVYRPIVFYSAGDPATDDKAIAQLNESITNAGLLGKGVFITARINLNNQASSIFQEMHSEEHEVNRVRGLLMDRVSEFDASVIDLVQNEILFELIPAGNAKPKIATDVKNYLKRDLDNAKKLYDDIKNLNLKGIQTFIKEHPKDISTYRKGYLLKSILKQVNVAEGLSDILSEGIDGVHRNNRGDEVKSLRDIRNEYGHITAENLTATHTDEMCIHIRQETRRQLKNIDDIREKLE
jgi:CheY-like chemotaxis protein